MGINYYARTNICEDCKRYDSIHIGKSSCGWTFSFHATDKIKSYKDWIKFLSDPLVKIFDEYGKEISLTEFKIKIESKKNEEHNHTIACIKSGYDNSYLDDEGNSMTADEFS